MENNLNENIKNSLVTVANATDLGAKIILSVVGNDVSDTLNGSRVSMESLRALGQARFKRNLESSN